MNTYKTLVWSTCLATALTTVQAQNYHQWTFKTPWPVPGFWTRGSAVDGFGGGLWVAHLHPAPNVSYGLILWMNHMGEPLARIELTNDVGSLSIIYASTNRAVVVNSMRTSAQSPLPDLVIQLERSTNAVTRSDYEIAGRVYTNLRSGSDDSGFFSSDSTESELTILRYSYTPSISAPVLLFQLASQGLDVTWQSQQGVAYQPESSDNLAHWTSTGNPLLGNGKVLSISTGFSKPANFFRIRATR